jgi:hypothetical protein
MLLYVAYQRQASYLALYFDGDVSKQRMPIE